ncbi:MAG: hypothetical protein U1F08_02115 [Steroidobacteraceae bacterium]
MRPINNHRRTGLQTDAMGAARLMSDVVQLGAAHEPVAQRAPAPAAAVDGQRRECRDRGHVQARTRTELQRWLQALLFAHDSTGAFPSPLLQIAALSWATELGTPGPRTSP